MLPFFQGKIDNFCAIYAVLNAVQLLCKINAITARSIFNETMLEISRDYYAFKAVLEHGTDYMELVDQMLEKMCIRYGLLAFAPFGTAQSPEKIWSVLTEYARPDLGRCAVFRFLRYEALHTTPMADHWTTSDKIDSEGLRLFDERLSAQLWILHSQLQRGCSIGTSRRAWRILARAESDKTTRPESACLRRLRKNIAVAH